MKKLILVFVIMILLSSCTEAILDKDMVIITSSSNHSKNTNYIYYYRLKGNGNLLSIPFYSSVKYSIGDTLIIVKK